MIIAHALHAPPGELEVVLAAEADADRAALRGLVRELRDAAYRLEREISSRFGHDDDMIPQTREPIEGMRAALASADVFLRGERSSGAEVAESGWLVEIPPFSGQPFWWRGGVEWTANATAAIRFARRQDAQAVADRVHVAAFVTEHSFFEVERPDVPPAPKAGEEDGRGWE
jgi:hypothetical protein